MSTNVIASTQGPTMASPLVVAVVRAVEEELRLAARVDVRVLITAEDREVREMCARFIHGRSSRSLRPFVILSGKTAEVATTSSSMSPRVNLSESALSPRAFEQARGGTLFIDDVAQLGASDQILLCSWVEEHAAPAADRRRSPFRIIAGANGQLDHERRSGRFSESLFYRLNLIHIDLLRYGSRAATGPSSRLAIKAANHASQ